MFLYILNLDLDMFLYILNLDLDIVLYILNLDPDIFLYTYTQPRPRHILIYTQPIFRNIFVFKIHCSVPVPKTGGLLSYIVSYLIVMSSVSSSENASVFSSS